MNLAPAEKTVRQMILAFACITAWHTARASGPVMPAPLLADGGHSITGAPEFFYETELRILANQYKGKYPELKPASRNGNAETALADENDFATAILAKKIMPPDPELAKRQNSLVRTFLNSDPDENAPMPPEFDSEFHDYHMGALAYRRGNTKQAREAFEKLLSRPAAERHYRTIWALYMLARIAGYGHESDRAISLCQRLRHDAGDGFPDSTDCVSGSFRLEMEYNEELDTELSLQEIALGGNPQHHWPGCGSLLEDMSQNDMERRARSQVLREVTTCRLMGGASCDYARNANTACARWLAAVEAAGITRARDADRLGWIAYIAGDYAGAARWLHLVENRTPLSLWLKAKLDLRAGRKQDALAAMKACIAILPEQEYHNVTYCGDEPFTTTGKAAIGETGLLQLACGNFHDSMREFLDAKLWLDAAWVAEQLMTTGELKTFVDRERPWDTSRETLALKFEREQSYDGDPMPMHCLGNYLSSAIPGEFLTYRLRWLLARRLTREGRIETAGAYYPQWLQADASVYLHSLKDARNPKLPKIERARSWWNAAWLARTRGLELTGTEREPDNAAMGGDYEAPPTRNERLSGNHVKTVYDNSDKTMKPIVDTVGLPTSRMERLRLLSIPQAHTLRWHYRVTAADHAWHAAKFLPDDSDELADVLNSAGRWFFKMNYGEQMSQKFYNAIEARCSHNDLGRKVLAAKNFTSDPGPWSTPMIKRWEEDKRAAESSVEKAGE